MDNKVTSKQQIINKIKDSANILVTVSNNPSVDALSAALALSVALDKLEKHATAVFSGEVPPAITFLKPEKTFENTVDSLRDFIIALDKEKADHLRYKVEGDMVKIFITPYRTTITSDDLEFSQGDYNVELILALGVDDQDHLDAALDAHGRILHDATVATITAGTDTSDLGGIDWHEDGASSLSEMVAQLVDGLKPDKNTSLLDQQVATALLTGIVAETDRFSNAKTTSQVMTVAATLMGAGADQQLVATKLQEGHVANTLEPPEAATPADIPADTTTPAEPKDKTTLSIEHEEAPEAEIKAEAEETQTPIEPEAPEAPAAPEAPVETPEPFAPTVPEAPSEEPELAPAAHPETLEELDRRVKAEHEAEAVDVAAEALQEEANKKAAAAAQTAEATAAATIAPTDSPLIGHAQTQSNQMDEPSFGGTLNATSEEAAEESRAELEDDRNKTTLNHQPYIGGASADQSVNGATDEEAPTVDPFASDAAQGPSEQSFAGTGMTIQPLEDMAAATSEQANAQPDLAALQQASTLSSVYAPEGAATPEATPSSLGLPLPPPLPDFASLQTPDVHSAYALDAAPADGLVAPPTVQTPDSGRIGDILPPAIPAAPAPETPPIAPSTPPANPGQFQIPGAPQV